MSEFPDLIVIAIALSLAFVVFLLLRELNLWYWRINAIIVEQEKTRHILTKLLNHQTTGEIHGELDDDWIVENVKTGEVSGFSEEEWDDIPNKDDYVLVKDNTEKPK